MPHQPSERTFNKEYATTQNGEDNLPVQEWRGVNERALLPAALSSNFACIRKYLKWASMASTAVLSRNLPPPSTTRSPPDEK